MLDAIKLGYEKAEQLFQAFVDGSVLTVIHELDISPIMKAKIKDRDDLGKVVV